MGSTAVRMGVFENWRKPVLRPPVAMVSRRRAVGGEAIESE